MILGPKILTNQIPDLNLKINNNTIPRCHDIKFLGLLIKDNLSWDLHINCIATKINKTLGLLYKIKNKLNKELLINLYYSLIYPHLTYCNIIMGNSPNSHIEILKKCQNRFIRIIHNLPLSAHTSSYFYDMKLLNLTQINILSISIFMYKFLHNNLPNFYNNFFALSSHHQQKITRHTPIFYTKRARIKLLTTSVKHTGPKIWKNIVPDSLKNFNSLHLFKNKLKKYLILKNTIFKKL